VQHTAPFSRNNHEQHKNAVGLRDMPRIIDLVRHWSIVTKRELICDKNGKATGAKDTKVENIGDRVDDMLEQMYELMVTDRKMLTKLLDERIAFNSNVERLAEMQDDICEALRRLPDAKV
jgi:hypothetical protein